MDVIETVAVKPTARNRWKAAFFVLLALSALAIELAREAANFAGARLPSGPPMSVMATPEYAIVQGSWVRTDGGSVLMPNSVLIQCDAGTMQCNEAQAQVMVSPGFRYLDVISQNYPVTAWTADSITYAKGDAGCVNYTTRIDIAQQRATRHPQDPQQPARRPAMRDAGAGDQDGTGQRRHRTAGRPATEHAANRRDRSAAALVDTLDGR